jgi:hypothetical protein|tara:strand:- start:851 stop:1141 length:291 start_codon:yes stop_codon:yes gene_type:complete
MAQVQGKGIVGRSKPTIAGNLGKYNKVHLVGNSTTFFATGSNEAAAFVVDGTLTQITLTFSGGGTATGDVFNAGEVHEIGVQKAVTGGASTVYLLR